MDNSFTNNNDLGEQLERYLTTSSVDNQDSDVIVSSIYKIAIASHSDSAKRFTLESKMKETARLSGTATYVRCPNSRLVWFEDRDLAWDGILKH